MKLLPRARRLGLSRFLNRRPHGLRQPKLLLEALETRDLPAAMLPTIVAVTPANLTAASRTVNPPPLQVTFSEDMKAADVINASNYLLFNSSGQPLAVGPVNYNNNGGMGPFVATLTYNGSMPLPSDSYTLLLRGNLIHDMLGKPLAQNGQLVVANSGLNSAAVIGVNNPAANDGQVEAPANYSSGGTAPAAVLLYDDALLLGQATASGVLDLLVASATSVSVFQGRAGGGYNSTPAATLALPASANPRALAVGNLDGKNGLDIAVADSGGSGTGDVTVFLSTSSTSLAYGAGVSYAAGQNPTAIVAADLDGDGKTDLVVADAGASSGAFNVTILPGNGSGAFTATPTTINTTATAALTGLAAFPGAPPNLAVSSAGGTFLLTNTSTAGHFAFSASQVAAAASSSVAVGDINRSGTASIVVANSTSGAVTAYLGPAFTTPTTLGTAGAGATAVTIANLGGARGNDVIVANGASANTVTVLVQQATAGTFLVQGPFTTGANPVALAVGDTNGDGKADVVTANATGNNVTVLRGAGDGTLWAGTNYSTGAMVQPGAVVTGDFNGDGLPDIAFAEPGSNKVGVLLATGVDAHGNLKYGPLATYGTGRGPVALAVGDFNGDKALDLAVVNQVDNNVWILLNNGMGTGFTHATANTVQVGSMPTQIVVADFNGDGNLDLAVSHADPLQNPGVTLALGNGDGTIATPTEIASGLIATSLATINLNNSTTGVQDLVVADNQAAAPTVDLFLNDGMGNFTETAVTPVGANPISIAVGDVNRDGFPDVVVASQSTTTTANLSVLLNTGGTGLAPAVSSQLFAGAQIQNIALTDVNQDAFPDLVVALAAPDAAGNNLYSLLGNGDGTFGTPRPYQAGGPGGTGASYVAAVADPLVQATTFFETLNTAPTLTTTAVTFPGLQQNTVPLNDPGLSVHDFLAGVTIADPDKNAKKGIAVTGVDNSHGQWQFSIDGGTSWTLFSNLSNSQAQVLADSTTDRIRFVPGVNYIGISQFNFRAWDQTVGTDGGFGNAVPSGGTSAFSTGVATTTITIRAAAADLVGREASGPAAGTWLVSLSNGANAFGAPTKWDAWAPDVPGKFQWVDVMTGDLTGDGHDDIIGRVLQTGQWWVAVSNGANEFHTSLWDVWNPNVTWADVHLADLNGDGKMDVVGRVLQTGEWWVGLSTGHSLATSHWDTWNSQITWVDVKFGDVTGNGRADIVGRAQSSGQWWVALSTGTAFTTQFWDQWNPAIAWANVRLADLAGNGRMDLIGMVPQTGEWWAALSTGSVFHTSRWGVWDPTTINHLAFVEAADFSGDGKADLTGFDTQTGQWFTSTSNGSSLSVPTVWENWDPTQTWVDAQVGDFTGDGLFDVVARNQTTGQWQMNLSNGALFNKSIWVTWDPTIGYVNVNKGNFG